MEIRTLRYFLAAAREENMTRAAEQLHVTQPTLSKALKSLEDELGKEHLGYLLTFDRLVDTSSESGLVFRPLTPRLETKLFIVWKRYQMFSPIADRFLRRIQASFSAT